MQTNRNVNVNGRTFFDNQLSECKSASHRLVISCSLTASVSSSASNIFLSNSDNSGSPLIASPNLLNASTPVNYPAISSSSGANFFP